METLWSAHTYEPALRRRRTAVKLHSSSKNFPKVNLNQPAPSLAKSRNFCAICDKKTVKIKLWLEHNAAAGWLVHILYSEIIATSYFRIFWFAASWTYLAWKQLLIRVSAFRLFNKISFGPRGPQILHKLLFISPVLKHGSWWIIFRQTELSHL